VTPILRRIPLALRDIFGGATPLLAAWVMALLAMPIVQWAVGHPGLIAGVILGVLLQASLAVLFLAQVAPFRRTVRTVGIVVTVAWASEALGSTTGFPFGAYDYTPTLQPQLLGVPLLIPLAWLMMLPPAWAVAQRISRWSTSPAGCWSPRSSPRWPGRPRCPTGRWSSSTPSPGSSRRSARWSSGTSTVRRCAGSWGWGCLWRWRGGGLGGLGIGG